MENCITIDRINLLMANKSYMNIFEMIYVFSFRLKNIYSIDLGKVQYEREHSKMWIKLFYFTECVWKNWRRTD